MTFVLNTAGRAEAEHSLPLFLLPFLYSFLFRLLFPAPRAICGPHILRSCNGSNPIQPSSYTPVVQRSVQKTTAQRQDPQPHDPASRCLTICLSACQCLPARLPGMPICLPASPPACLPCLPASLPASLPTLPIGLHRRFSRINDLPRPAHPRQLCIVRYPTLHRQGGRCLGSVRCEVRVTKRTSASRDVIRAVVESGEVRSRPQPSSHPSTVHPGHPPPSSPPLSPTQPHLDLCRHHQAPRKGTGGCQPSHSHWPPHLPLHRHPLHTSAETIDTSAETADTHPQTRR